MKFNFNFSLILLWFNMYKQCIRMASSKELYGFFFYVQFLLKIDNRKIENWISFLSPNFCILMHSILFKPASKLFSMQVRKIDTSNPEAIKKVFNFFPTLPYNFATLLIVWLFFIPLVKFFEEIFLSWD